jgi:hypothetical protein
MRREIFTLVTDVTGLDGISDAYFARDFGGCDMQVPTATKIAGPRGKPAPWGHLLPLWADSLRFGRAEIRLAAARGCLGWPDCSGVDNDNCSHPRAPCPWGAVDLSGSYRLVRVGAGTLRDLQVIRSGETR